MKNNKIDSDILNDNYFLEKEKNSIEFNHSVHNFFKIIQFTILNTVFYIFSIFLLLFVVYLISPSLSSISLNFIIWSMMLLSYIPFLFLLYYQIKNENLLNSNWQIWVSFLTFLVIMLFTYGEFEISNF
jgi:uncharacterized BrkB/YihY/UPF0761 family membrane protein